MLISSIFFTLLIDLGISKSNNNLALSFFVLNKCLLQRYSVNCLRMLQSRFLFPNIRGITDNINLFFHSDLFFQGKIESECVGSDKWWKKCWKRFMLKFQSDGGVRQSQFYVG
jgi:hypothetical protein